MTVTKADIINKVNKSHSKFTNTQALKSVETVLIMGNKPSATKCQAEKKGFIQGFKTIFACCADEAHQIASKYPKIDMLLTDLLPDNNYRIADINGLQFAQEFARKYPKTKIVFMIP